MTPTPLPYLAPTPPGAAETPEGSRRGTVVAWAVILGCVGLVFARTTIHYYRSGAAQSGQAVEGVTLKINARIALGAKAAATRLGGGAGFNGAAQAAPFEAVVADTSAAPEDRLRAVTVLGELLGAQAASARLDRVAPNLTSSPDLKQDADLLRTIYADGPDALSAGEADRLIDRHGWFARLALAAGRPAGDPARAAAEGPALRAFVGAAVALLAGVVALIVGVVLLVLALVRLGDGQLRRAYLHLPEPAGTGPFLEGFAVYLASLIGLSLALGTLWPHPPVWANLLLGIAIVLAVGWVRLRGVGWDHLRRGLGWHSGQGVFCEVGAGFVGYLATLPLMALGLLASLLLQKASHITPTHPAQEMVGGPTSQVLQLYLLAAVFAPITEELMFRGAFYHPLRRRLAWPVAALVCGLVFALIHPQGWVGAPPLVALGFAFACLREWRGSLLAPMTAHACNNFVTITLLVLLAR